MNSSMLAWFTFGLILGLFVLNRDVMHMNLPAALGAGFLAGLIGLVITVVLFDD